MWGHTSAHTAAREKTVPTETALGSGTLGSGRTAGVSGSPAERSTPRSHEAPWAAWEAVPSAPWGSPASLPVGSGLMLPSLVPSPSMEEQVLGLRMPRKPWWARPFCIKKDFHSAGGPAQGVPPIPAASLAPPRGSPPAAAAPLKGSPLTLHPQSHASKHPWERGRSCPQAVPTPALSIRQETNFFMAPSP